MFARFSRGFREVFGRFSGDFREVFARFSRGFRFQNIFVKGSGEQKKQKNNQFFACRGGPRPAAPPNRGPRGTQKLVRTVTAKNDGRKYFHDGQFSLAMYSDCPLDLADDRSNHHPRMIARAKIATALLTALASRFVYNLAFLIQSFSYPFVFVP